MKLKFLGIFLVSMLAFVLFSGGLSGGSVAEGVYLPLPGVSEYVYSPTSATKGLTKLSAINKNVEINFGKDNYLLYGGNTVSGAGIGVYVRNANKLPTNDNSDWNGCFSQSRNSVTPSVPANYIDHQTDWIVKPLSPVYTIVPKDDFSTYDVEGSSGDWDTGYSIISPSAITLKYSSSMADVFDTVSVLYRLNDNTAWEVLPCVVNASSKTVTATFSMNGFGSYCVANIDSDFNEFSQMIGSVDWSHQYVTSLWTKGIMSQTRDSGYFGLVDSSSQECATTRGEFASMLVKGMRLPLVSMDANIFSDVASTTLQDTSNSIIYEYYYPYWRQYACTAANYGLVSGIRNGNTLEFQPNAPITREQAALLITRAAKLKVSYVDDPASDKVLTALQKLYTDADTISVWARPYVFAASKAKYMVGIPVTGQKNKYTFNPQDSLTRAQTAKIISMLLKNLKLI